MKLLSVNIAQPITIEIGPKRYRTGIYKTPAPEPLWLGRDNIRGDGQADLRNHGGPYRAVYIYPHEHYQHWAKTLGRKDFPFGQFGENLTTHGLLEDQVCVGDIYQIGEAIIQVTQPRVPCFKLANKMGIPDFAKTFLRANRPGFYARALQEGPVGPGDPITLLRKDPVGMTVAEVNAALHLDKNPSAARRALRIEALSPDWRKSCEALLKKDPSLSRSAN